MSMRILIPFFCLVTLAGCAGSRAKPSMKPGPRPHTELLSRVHFPTDSARALAKDEAIIDESARWMSKNPDAVVVLEGHCDERESEDYNLELGDRRARDMMGELIDRGVDGERFIVVSKGENEPLDGRGVPSAWQKNRRVDFIIR